ncbi:hypothetical protein [Methylobacterium sp. 190mf]|uniref:hypothetical protein n=1 Tax=Methylobacterium sp. 190mf TaxID=1761798 RepID=UPI0032AF4A50
MGGDGEILPVQPAAEDLGTIAATRVALATMHRDRDTRSNADANFIALCQRCHMRHDRPEHRRRRWRTLF